MNDDEKRIDIEDIPKAAEELTDEEAKKVEGGAFYGTGVYKSTDSGRMGAGNTIGGSLSVDPSNPNKS